MPKISIIVPVYNVEKYIDKCLRSLTLQTLQDIEIIIVNDGSLDKSVEIIEKYVKENWWNEFETKYSRKSFRILYK